jgi:hypothetical protein
VYVKEIDGEGRVGGGLRKSLRSELRKERASLDSLVLALPPRNHCEAQVRPIMSHIGSSKAFHNVLEYAEALNVWALDGILLD